MHMRELPREGFGWGYVFAELREYGTLRSAQTASVTDTKWWKNTREGVEKRLQRGFGWEKKEQSWRRQNKIMKNFFKKRLKGFRRRSIAEQQQLHIVRRQLSKY